MSNGDDDGEDAADAEAQSDGADAPAATPEEIEQRLDDIAESLDAAETEADLDDIEAELDAVGETLEETDLPVPDDEDAEDPNEALQSRVEELEGTLEEQRGPYVSDVVEIVETAAGEIRETRWTDDGAAEAETAVATFLESVDEQIDADVGTEGDAAERLDEVAGTLSGVDLDPDADAETIEGLLDAANTLADDVEAAEAWEDLTVQEQLTEQGFYDVMTSERRKDYPPEWNAVKLYEKQYQKTRDEEAIEYILLALEKLESDFMEENILDTLERIGPPEALDDMLQLAGRRDKHAIRVLGKIGDDEALDTLVDYIDGEGDAALQIATLRALGAIGSEEATQAVANRLAAENEDVRSTAARALGRIGDTRAVAPLQDVLADTEEADAVRASAAWALRQIGTERALEAAGEYANDEAFLVQAEAEKVSLSS
jgi:HEAT repeat protein